MASIIRVTCFTEDAWCAVCYHMYFAIGNAYIIIGSHTHFNREIKISWNHTPGWQMAPLLLRLRDAASESFYFKDLLKSHDEHRILWHFGCVFIYITTMQSYIFNKEMISAHSSANRCSFAWRPLFACSVYQIRMDCRIARIDQPSSLFRICCTWLKSINNS